MLPFVISSCLEPYNPKVLEEPHQYLTIEGSINISNVPTTIFLTKSRNLRSDTNKLYVNDASVIVKGSDSKVYHLEFKGNGRYEAVLNHLDPAIDYAMEIVLQDGRKYYSDFVKAKVSPEIKNISYEILPSGIQIFLSTEDLKNNTHYYQWEFTETWKFNAPFNSALEYKSGNLVLREPSIYTCFKSKASDEVLIGTSSNLSSDIINNFPLKFIDLNTNRLENRYSINIRQRALTLEAFNYYTELKKLSESTGSLFDVQPYQLTGNFHSVNQEEPVIGFLSVGTVEEKRIYIDRNEIAPGTFDRSIPNGVSNCYVDTIKLSEDKSPLKYLFSGTNFYPISYFGLGTSTLLYTSRNCVDCRMQEGVLEQPLFWKDK